MATFSVSEAAGAGFRLIGRRPLAIAAWGLVYLVVGVAPQFAVMAAVWPDVGTLAREAHANVAAASGPPDMAKMLQLQSKMMMLQPVTLVSSIAAQTILLAAIFRAVLEPQNSAFAYLRLGRQELWMALVSLALGLLAVLVMAALLIPFIIVGAVMAAGVSQGHAASPAAILLFVLLALGAMTVFAWAFLRLSMALPMTFARRGFILFESWAFTRGQAARLFGLLALLILIILAVEILFVVVALILFGLAIFPHLTELKVLIAGPPQSWLGVMAPGLVAVVIVGGLFIAGFFAVIYAPFADAYRQLVAEPSAS